MRLLILLILLYLAYRSLKSWMFKNISSENTIDKNKMGAIDDVMLKDPYCKIYFPRKSGIHCNIDGKDLCFCSKECRDKFIASKKKKKNK